LLLSSGPAAAAPARPAWSIELTSYPSDFVPNSTAAAFSANYGPGLQILATNVGGERTSGEFTVTVTLPPGVTALSAGGKFAGRTWKLVNSEMTCSVAASVVTCVRGVLNPSETQGVGPGEQALIFIPLDVTSVSGGSVTAEATISGGGAAEPRSTVLNTPVTEAIPPFGFLPGSRGFGGSVTEADGSATTLAGAHPYDLAINLGFPSYGVNCVRGCPVSSGGGVRDVSVTLPHGLVVNPAATPKCRESELESPQGCPADTQVGLVTPDVALINGPSVGISPLYNMVAPAGSPGEFGFEVVGLESVYVHLDGHLRSDGLYELAADAHDITAKAPVYGIKTQLWGDPSAATHDEQRGICFTGIEPNSPCPVPRLNTAFLTMPSACSGPLETRGSIDSWEQPTLPVPDSFLFSDLDGNPVGVDGCGELGFEPTIDLTPSSQTADSPTGLAVNLHVPQNEEVENAAGESVRSGSTLKDAQVVLPKGFSVNPSAAGGRTACTAAQVGLTSAVGDEVARFSDVPATCPDTAKIGTVEVITPLLKDEGPLGEMTPHPLPGSIYLAQPYENPFGSLLGIYLAVYDPQTGVVIKLAGKVDADPQTGQLTATFRENPELPFEDLKLEFFGGPRAALKTAATCGTYSAQSDLSPWSGTAPVASSQQFAVTDSPDGGACASTPGQQPNSPSFQAGTLSPLAGAYSPFVMRLTRGDGSQEFGSLNVTLPTGLTGKLAGTPYCSDSAVAAAVAKSGREEEASAACPKASEVGTVTVGAGSGSQPYYVPGTAYLAGPYKGAPLSLAIVTPAVAGPYDLGDVVVRAALFVDPYTTQITVKSDPLPTILKGIPLDIRSLAVQIGKPEFTLNPTSCEPSTVNTEAVSTIGQPARVSSHFQASGCSGLNFKPKLQISLKGPTKRTGHPALRAVVTYPQKGAYANIARAQVSLPHSEFLDQSNIGQACTKTKLAADACTAKSIYGKAKAWSPLLEKPLEGPVYLVGGYGYKLPALVAELDGQIKVLLVGKVDSGPKKGIRNTFEAVPDAPVEKFVLEMKGGKKYGLLINSENVCKKRQMAGAAFKAQNGKFDNVSVKIANSCKSGQKGKKKSAKSAAKPNASQKK
jgi:hypothetical protein